MKTFVKIIFVVFIVGIVLVVAGVASGANIESVRGALTDESSYVAYDETIEDDFESIYVHTDNKNVDIKVSHVIEKPQLTYYLKETESISFLVGDEGVLEIDLKIKQNFLGWFSFGWTPSEYSTLVITLPSTYQGKLHVETAAGNILVDGVFSETILDGKFGNIEIQGTYQSLDVDLSAGNVKLTNTTVLGHVDVHGQSGNIVSNNLEVVGSISFSTSAGNIDMKDSKGSSYILKTSAGNIKANLDLNTSNYKYRLKTNAGNIRLNNSKVSNDYESGTGILVDAQTSAGNIDIQTK